VRDGVAAGEGLRRRESSIRSLLSGGGRGWLLTVGIGCRCAWIV
jgi:hypothetical protein